MRASIVIHRASEEIGGNCVEIVAPSGERLLLDAGEPLAPSAGGSALPATLDLSRPVAGVLISHPHRDHWGLLDRLPAAWPVYCGEATAKLIRLTTGIRGAPIEKDFRSWRSAQRVEIGPFAVTPWLTDHSAFDAYMLLIETAGQRILYSGDFRRHGRKSVLVDRLMGCPLPDIDVLIMEGTNLGTDKPCMSEQELETAFVELFHRTPGRVFVAWSEQNIDRTVTLYRACLKAERALAVDLYTADVLDTLSAHGAIPRPGWRGLDVVLTAGLRVIYAEKRGEAFIERLAKCGIGAAALAAEDDRHVVMVRRSLIQDYSKKGVVPTPRDAWSWSMWSGYLRETDGLAVREWFEAGGTPACHIHTSGHASPSDLRAFATRMAPRLVVPIHGLAWDAPHDGFPPIMRLRDGERLQLH